MLIIDEIENLIKEIEGLLEDQNSQLNQNGEINDLFETKKGLIKRIQDEFLEEKEGIEQVISYLNLEENEIISNFLEYLKKQLGNLKNQIEEKLSLDKKEEIRREIEILHFELKTILQIKDDEDFKKLIGLYTKVSQKEEEVLEEHENLINEREIELLTSNSDFNEECKDKLKKIFKSNEGILLLKLLKENCQSDKTYESILKWAFASGILQNPKIQQLEVNKLLEVIKEFINLRKDCDSDKTYESILKWAFASGILQNPKIQQLEVNKLLEVIKEFINLRKDCDSDEMYENILKHLNVLIEKTFHKISFKEYFEIFKKNRKEILKFKFINFLLDIYKIYENKKNQEFTIKEKEKIAIEMIKEFEINSLYFYNLNTKRFNPIVNLFGKIYGKLKSNEQLQGKIYRTQNIGFLYRIYPKKTFQLWKRAFLLDFSKIGLNYKPIEPILKYYKDGFLYTYDFIKKEYIQKKDENFISKLITEKILEKDDISKDSTLIYTKVCGIDLSNLKKFFPNTYEKLEMNNEVEEFKDNIDTFLKKNGINHGDIFSRNILFNFEDEKLYLIDFGIVKKTLWGFWSKFF